MTDKQYLYGSIFLLANKFQNIGDNMGGELPIKQWFLLTMIDMMDTQLPTMTEVAKFVGGTRQNTTRMLQSLENKGFVNLSMLPEDRTSMRVTLCKKGKEYLKQSYPIGNAMLEQLFDGIDNQMLLVMSSTFQKLFENIERWDIT